MSTDHLQHYLRTHSGSSHIHLVGPLANSPVEFAEPVIFVDGGAAFRQGNVGIVVGDGDSFAGPMDYHLDPDKDFSDLAFALSLVDSGFGKVYLHGFSRRTTGS